MSIPRLAALMTVLGTGEAVPRQADGGRGVHLDAFACTLPARASPPARSSRFSDRLALLTQRRSTPAI